MQFDDYLQIRNLMNRYAHLMDQAKHGEVGQLFAHADLYLAGGIVYRSDAKGVAREFDRWNRVYEDTGTLRTRHITTNLILEDDGPNGAKAQSYIVVHQATPNFPLQPIIAGTYLDRFEKVDGKWRFKERRCEPQNFELFGNLSNHLKLDLPQAG